MILPSSHTIHICIPIDTLKSNKFSYRVHIWSCSEDYPLSSDVDGVQTTDAFLANTLHFLYSQLRQNPDIPHVQSIHKLQKELIK